MESGEAFELVGKLAKDDEATALSGVNLLAAAAPEQPDWLTPALSHPRSTVRYRALQSLVPSEQQLPRLLELLRDQDSNLCGYAALALSKYKGPLSAEQIDYIVSAVRRDVSDWTRQPVFKLLEDRRPDGPHLRQMILDGLNSDSFQAREWAVQTLRTRGADATELYSTLMEGIRAGRLDGDAAVLVIEAGRPIESLDDARLMIQLLYDASSPPGPGPIDKSQLLRQLIRLCPTELPSSVVLDALAESLGAVETIALNVNAETRKATARLLSEIANDPTAALPRLRELLKHPRWETRQGAVFALEAWGPRAKSAAGMLIERLTDPEIRVRMAAADALGAIGPDAGPEAAAALAKMAKHDALPGGQMHAVNALGKMGPHLQAHLGTLEELSKRSDRMVRDAAARVLSRQKAQIQ
jgi:HEAT repeat protein